MNWIACKDEQPPMFQNVLCHCGGIGDLMVVARRFTGCNFEPEKHWEWIDMYDRQIPNKITHWMRLPMTPFQKYQQDIE